MSYWQTVKPYWIGVLFGICAGVVLTVHYYDSQERIKQYNETKALADKLSKPLEK